MAEKYEYTLTLNTAQAREVQNALEAIMRWILKQPDIMREYLPDRLDWSKGPEFDASLAKRNAATELLKAANNLMCPYNLYNGSESPLQTEQWHRIYGIYQVVRHAIWEAESDKQYCVVDGNRPFPSGDEPLPKIEWKKVEYN